MKLGDLVFTNFFGQPHKAGLILEVKQGLYGNLSYLVLLPEGRQVYFKPEDLLTFDNVRDNAVEAAEAEWFNS